MSQTSFATLERALPLLRLPTSPDQPPTPVADPLGIRCSTSGGFFPLRDGILDLLDPSFEPNTTQRLLDHGLSAQLYDWARPRLPWILGMPAFVDEAADVVERLEIHSGDVVLDLACGQGNFTQVLSAQVGRTGLVIGLDISRAMLARAAARVRRDRLENVLLLRADALRLPIASGALRRVNCSGGLHQFPDLPRALAEMGRVSAVGGRVTVSGFATEPGDRFARFKAWLQRRLEAHFIPMDEMASDLARGGFEDVRRAMAGSWVGYAWARRGAG